MTGYDRVWRRSRRAPRLGGLLALVVVGVLGAASAAGCLPTAPGADPGASLAQQPSPGASRVAPTAPVPTTRATAAVSSTPMANPTPSVLGAAPAVPTPAAQASPSAPPVRADWRTYANPDLGFALSYPPGLEVSPNGANSVTIGGGGDERGPASRTFVYVSVIPEGFQSQGGEVYNYNTPEAAALFALAVGESRSLHPGGDPAVARAFTYTRLPDATLGSLSARVYVNTNPWEAPPGTTEFRYYVTWRDAMYLVGGYVMGESAARDGAISEGLFRQILGTLRFTGPPDAPLACTDRASFVADVTIPDGARVAPGVQFVKTWGLRNRGTCAWTADYALVFAGGAPMGAAPAVPLGRTVAPGEVATLSVTLTAPAAAGTYRGAWRLRNAQGVTFGIDNSADGTFWVEITVAAPAT